MTKWDKFLIFFILVVSLPAMFLTIFFNTSVKQKYVWIRVDGKEIKKISIGENDGGKIYEFPFGRHRGYIEVKDGVVRMLEMDRKICPDAICSDTGWIRKKYQSIICLPNKIVVGFQKEQEDEVDIISY
ncbi:NusG domain II-containing protein [Thermotalea metallivorans]|nr:NusG domain II-containing protein [Thermotalea metallivorans]